jgi:protein-disulfide isomerase
MPTGGNAQGDVTIVEFFDYRCPYCKQAQPSLETLLKEDHKLRFVYKENASPGAASVAAAHAALAAQRQGKYEAFHTAMMAAKGQITDPRSSKSHPRVGLDIDRLKRDMTAPAIGEAINNNLALAEALTFVSQLSLVNFR